MLKSIFIFTLIVKTLFAQPSVAEVKSAVQANPALLDTPQAQKLMNERGINKNTVLDKINNSNNKNITDTKSKEVKNNLDYGSTTQNNINSTRINNRTTFINPLKYKDNKKVLQELVRYQVVKRDKKLKRFGTSFFINKNPKNTNNGLSNSYIINRNDIVSIWIYGSKNKNFLLEVNEYGDIDIPNIGPLYVLGKNIKTVKKYVTDKLQNTYPNSNVSVSVKSNSSIQVNLVGDVKAPGLYNINVMSDVKNLLVLAQGVKESGSLRNVMIKRNNRVLAHIDFYKLLINGNESTNIVLQNNDKVIIPKVKKLVSLYGEVNNEAKYELKKYETLADLLVYARGIKSSASKVGFVVKRYNNNTNYKTIEVNLNQSKNFRLKDGDKVYVYKIDKIHNQSVYLYGNVVRPGEKELPKNKSLKKLLRNQIAKLSLKGVFLPDTLFSYALIKRQTSDLRKKVISFNLKFVLEAKNDILLKDNDEIYIFNRYNTAVTPYVKIQGKPVLNAGEYRYFENIKVRDIINQAGVTIYDKNTIKVLTYNTKDFMPQNKIVDEDYILHPFDEIKLFSYYLQNKIKYINIYGQINNTGKYVLNKNMTIKDAIKLAGGFNNKSYTSYIEIVRYTLKENERIKKIIKVENKDFNTFVLQDYDELTIHTIPNWTERKIITLKGEVKFPGNYVIQSGDRLSDVIKRAGGYTKSAFLDGALFTRDSIKKLQQTKMRQAILELKQKAISMSTAPSGIGEGNNKVDTASLVNMIDSLSKEAEKLSPIGRISINLDSNLTKFSNSTSNLVLKDKDTLTIPSFNDTILVIGEIMNSTSIIFKSTNVFDYIKATGGLNQRADEDNIFIVHANGSATKVKNGWFSGSSTHKIKRGDTIIVPRELVTYTGMQIAKDISSILYQFALTAASLTVVGAL